ncbi:MAG: tryptophan synthase subunit alpha [Planctomycetota bacterium]|nr:tryptophan synthase subunit alpha [Planctomycetota bacterium]
MTALSQVFADLRAMNRKAFIPFLTIGDPDLPSTALFLRSLAYAGATAVELGFPYSDPIADGPVIQASYTRALSHKTGMDELFRFAKSLVNQDALHAMPRLAMLSYSLIHRRVPERFVIQSRENGICGLIVPDLPIEESPYLQKLCQREGLDLVQLVTPTTPQERAKRILACSSGFVYCVSVAGITGTRNEIPVELLDQLGWLKSQTSLPLCVGFGISRPDQATLLRNYCDGVIVGSALVKICERATYEPVNQIATALEVLATAIIQALNP